MGILDLAHSVLAKKPQTNAEKIRMSGPSPWTRWGLCFRSHSEVLAEQTRVCSDRVDLARRQNSRKAVLQALPSADSGRGCWRGLKKLESVGSSVDWLGSGKKTGEKDASPGKDAIMRPRNPEGEDAGLIYSLGSVIGQCVARGIWQHAQGGDFLNCMGNEPVEERSSLRSIKDIFETRRKQNSP